MRGSLAARANSVIAKRSRAPRLRARRDASRPAAKLRAFALLGVVMVLWAGNSIVGRAVRFDVPPLTLAFVRWAGASLLLSAVRLAAAADATGAAIRTRWMPVLAARPARRRRVQFACSTRACATPLRPMPCCCRRPFRRLVVLLEPAVLRRAQPAGPEPRRRPLRSSAWRQSSFEGDPARALELHFGVGDLLVLASVRRLGALHRAPAPAPGHCADQLRRRDFPRRRDRAGAVCRQRLAVGRAASPGGRACSAPSPMSACCPRSWPISSSTTRRQVVGAARAGLAITLMPMFGAFLSAALLGEKLHAYHFAGMALILAGIAPVGASPCSGQAGAGAGGTPPLGESA